MPAMWDVLLMSDRLQTELPQMLGEHKAIVAALHTLIDAAQRENQMAYAHVAEKLMLHAQTEEEVLYPTAILISLADPIYGLPAHGAPPARATTASRRDQ
jgi:hypothetical protein